MNWKKYVSMAMTVMVLTTNVMLSAPVLKTYAEENSSSQKDSSDSEKSDGDSSDSSSDPEKSDKDSGSDSSGDSGSSDSSKSSSDSGSTDSDSSDSVENAQDSGDSSDESDTKSENSQSSQSEGGNTTDKKDSSNANKETSEKTAEDTDKKTSPKKKVVEDDSDGKDYQKSETVSSGNLTFTIVAVTKDSETIDNKIKELQKKEKELTVSEKKAETQLQNAQKETSDIEYIYEIIRQDKNGVENVDLYLMGCSKDAALGKKEDRIYGLDDLLSQLADTYDNASLKKWTSHYSTELQPSSIQISQTDQEKVVFSNAAPLLKLMEAEAKENTSTYQTEYDQVKAELEDVQSHIKTLEKKKKEGTMNLDTRLLEYKDVIPEQAVDFLNAVVSREGAPYVWGSDGPDSFDCSGLVSYGLRECGAVSAGFRWTSIDFASQLQSVTFEEAKPGDLVWKPGHIAIYIDENTVFEAPYTGANVRFTSCSVSTRFKKVLRWWSEK